MCPACLLKLGTRGSTQGSLAANEVQPAADTPVHNPQTGGDTIGRYRLLKPLGEGGFGTVWMAEQQEPVRRKVALKVLKLGMDTRQVVARFEAERQALALMDHPNIARVFDGGATEAGRPFFVMELVDGIPITEFCDTRRLSSRERIELFILVCQAVQHAHQKGIIHRDLKPSNILVTQQDQQAVPKIIDFGVAKAVEDPLIENSLFTRFHQFLGTPAYMSPEQAGLDGLDVDTRTDIYALGVILYEVLTGLPPLRPSEPCENHREAMFKAIREQEPIRPSTRLSQWQRNQPRGQALAAAEGAKGRIDADLDWIILKALEKDRRRRYESTSAFAADLRRFLDSEPVLARPPSRIYRTAKLVRRNKVVFAAAGAVLLALLAGLAVSLRQTLRASQHLAEARLNAYVHHVNVAHQALQENHLQHVRELLRLEIPQPGETKDLRGFEWYYLRHESRSDSLEMVLPGGGDAVGFSGDGRWLAQGGGKRVVVLHATSLEPAAILEAPCASLSFSPDGERLATASPESVTVWKTGTWREETRLPGTNSIVLFSPDSAWLVTGAAPGLALWRVSDWKRVAECPASPDIRGHLCNGLAISPDCTELVTMWIDIAHEQAGMRFWKLPSLEPSRPLFPAQMPLACAAFTPDGARLVTGAWDGRLMVWDIREPAPKLLHEAHEHSSHISRIAIPPHGNVIATVGEDQALNLWDLASYRHLARLRGHTNQIGTLGMSPDGRTVVTGSGQEGVARLWSTDCRNTTDLFQVGSLIAGFTSDSVTVVTGPREGAEQWHLCGPTSSACPAPTNIVLPSEMRNKPFDVYGPRPIGALGHTGGRVEVRDLATGTPLSTWQAERSEINHVRFSPDGTRIATASAAGRVVIWDAVTPAETMAFNPNIGPVTALAYAPNGQTLAVGAAWARVYLWDLQTPRQFSTLGETNSISWIGYSRDGRQVAVADLNGTVTVFSLPSRQRIASLQGHVMGVLRAEFFPDGKTLVTGALDGKIKFWNVATHQEIMSLSVPLGGTFRSLAISPDGQTLAVGYMTWPGHHVRLFRAPR